MPTGLPREAPRGRTVVVFISFTLLYRLNTLLRLSRINHKSPVSRQFRQIFT
jgi:hypothetical protein